MQKFVPASGSTYTLNNRLQNAETGHHIGRSVVKRMAMFGAMCIIGTGLTAGIAAHASSIINFQNPMAVAIDNYGAAAENNNQEAPYDMEQEASPAPSP
jgi:hypothetical protein